VLRKALRRANPINASGGRCAKRAARALALASGLAAAGSCSGDFQFTQLPEFEAARAALGSDLPDAQERALLELHRPEFYLPEGHKGMIDFYRDYVARGVLADGAGEVVSAQVTPEILNEHKDDPGARFTHVPPGPGEATPKASVYAGISRVDMPYLGGEFAVLSYHAVFRTSGLPAEITATQEWLARAFGDREDWHQLDHYTAVFVALNPAMEPCAVVLQKHNYMRTYVIGEGTEFPRGAPVRVDVAVDSNELYPHSPERTRHRAVGFINADSVGFLLGLDDDPPFMQGSHDVTEGARRAEYDLQYLPPDDAFYVFQGYLGEKRLLPGRDGPPGAMYNTEPSLAAKEAMLPGFYWREGDEEYAALARQTLGFETDLGGVMPRLQERLAAALRQSGCVE